MKLQQIDELTRPEHSFLARDDQCYFLREYTAGAGYEHGETNNLISNLKKKVDRHGRPEWRYKELAVQQAGKELRKALLASLREYRERLTIVPMPPSRIKTNPLYDDRVQRIVDVMTKIWTVTCASSCSNPRTCLSRSAVFDGKPAPREQATRGE